MTFNISLEIEQQQRIEIVLLSLQPVNQKPKLAP